MTEKIDNIGASTLAHELVSREEQNIGIFFAAFAIQFYMSKDILKQKLNKPLFLMYFGDVEIYASQRVLIKNIISSYHYKSVCDEIEFLLNEHNIDSSKQPYDILLGRINKAFLIRQIFKQTDQVLPKYNFIDNYMGLDISQLEINALYKDMELLPVEQKILVLCRLFTQMKDAFENKKKTIFASFLENIRRTQNEYIAKGKSKTQEFFNLEMLLKSFKN